MLTIIFPAYNEEAMIAEAVRAVSEVLRAEGEAFEIVFVDDGSRDGTWAAITAEAAADPAVRGISFSRNFGKEAAIYAGLAEARGDACIVMDSDLQHPPAVIPEMLKRWREGFAVVEGVKKSRGKENGAHSLFAALFYRLFSGSTDIDLSDASDFKLLDRRAIDALLSLPEKKTFFRALSSWIGFPSAEVPFDVAPRRAGRSKWSSLALTRYALSNISSFSALPMQLVTVLGVITFAATLILSVIALYQKLTGSAVDGFTTVIILQGFIGSITMLSLGIIGYYIANIYDEIKARPKYIIDRRTPDPL